MAEQVVLSKTITIDDNVFTFNLSDLNDNTIKTGSVNKVLLNIKTNSILFNFYGGNPTSSNSFQAINGKVIEITGLEDILNFKAVRATSNNATVFITYYK